MMKMNTQGWAALTLALLTSTAALAQEEVSGTIQIGDGQREYPESITSTADGAIYSGSLRDGAIYIALPGEAQAAMMIPSPTTGPAATFGVHADESSNTLWACYADMASFAGTGQPSVLRGYDLTSGAEKIAITLDGKNLCNDIATTANGTAYVADTIGAAIYTVAPGASDAAIWAQDESMAGADGLDFGPDGALYVNSVTTGKLFRIDVQADGTAGAITELSVSEPLTGPDGMRFGANGKLYVTENALGRVTELTIDGDTATARPLPGPKYQFPTGVTFVGDTLYVLEAKLDTLGAEADPGAFSVYPAAID